LPPERALAVLTSDAAKLLGVSDKIGRIDRGLSADLVVWSEHPFSAGARVERVYIAGREVYSAEGGSP
jgi:imidazolonepropionase-like amidohydrolase